MSLKNLTIEDAFAIANVIAARGAGEAPSTAAATSDGRKVIVRSRDAGVQYGELVGYEGSTVHLKNARQMWSWTAKEGGTLLDCANHGVSKGKFSTAASAVTIIGACAIIDVADKAVESLEAAKWA